MVNSNLYEQIITHFGSVRRASQYFQVSHTTMANWKKSIPKRRVNEFKKVLKINPDRLISHPFTLPPEIVSQWLEHIENKNKKNKTQYTPPGAINYLYDKFVELNIKSVDTAVALVKIAIMNNWLNVDFISEAVLSHLEVYEKHLKNKNIDKKSQEDFEKAKENLPQIQENNKLQHPGQQQQKATQQQPKNDNKQQEKEDLKEDLTPAGVKLLSCVEYEINYLIFESELSYNSYIKQLCEYKEINTDEKDKRLIKHFLKKHYATCFNYD